MQRDSSSFIYVVVCAASMQGSSGKSVMRLKNGGSPLEVNTWQKASNNKSGVFSVERCMTYSVGKRLLSLNITQMGCAGRVNIVSVDLTEQSGKATASANLNMRFILNHRYPLFLVSMFYVDKCDYAKSNIYLLQYIC